MSVTNLKYKNVYFDSDDEVFFAMWCEELRQNKLIEDWQRNTTPIHISEGLKIPYTKVTQLKTKTKTEQKYKILLRPSEYTADIIVFFTDKGLNLFCSSFSNFEPERLFFTNTPKTGSALFEVKPSFDQNNMERLFVNNQKFIWDKYKIFVNLIEPVELFKKTFLPLEAAPYFKYRKSPTGKNKGIKQVGDWKMDWQPKTINEYLCL